MSPGRHSGGVAAGLALGAIVSVQLGSATATTLFDEIGPAGTVLFRLLFAAVILVAIWRPHPGRSSRDQLALAALFGLVLAAMNILFYESINRIPLGIAVTLEFIGPLGVAIAGSRRPLDLVWAGLAAAGIVLLAGPGGSSPDAAGICFGLAAGGCWAAYILLSARLGRAYPDGTGLAIAMVVASGLMVIPGVAVGGADLLQPRLAAVGLAVAVLSSAIPYSFEFEALRRIPTKTFGVLMSLEPAVAALIGLIALSQGLLAGEAIGIAMVVAAGLGALREAAFRAPPEA